MDGLQLFVKRWVDLANCWPTEARCSRLYHNTPVHKSEQESVVYFLEKGLEEKVSSVSGVWELVHFSSGFWVGVRIHWAVWMGLVQGSMVLPVSSLLYWLTYLKVILIIFTINLQSCGFFFCLSVSELAVAPCFHLSNFLSPFANGLYPFSGTKPFRSTWQAEKAYSLVILLVSMVFEDSHIKNEKPIFIYTLYTQKCKEETKIGRSNREEDGIVGWRREYEGDS